MSKTPTLINFGGKYLKKKSVLIQRKRETPHDHVRRTKGHTQMGKRLKKS